LISHETAKQKFGAQNSKTLISLIPAKQEIWKILGNPKKNFGIQIS
jgi:hypothetical protein